MSENGIGAPLLIRLDLLAGIRSMRALFKGAKLEVESVIRDVTERVLYDQDVSKETQRLRAVALGSKSSLFSVYSKVLLC